jgi:glycosyltransferase involved in cell wall biosynthesis
MKILWHSNSPWSGTGYGMQTATFVPKLSELYEVAISASYGLNGAPSEWQGIKVYPGAYDAYGNDVIAAHALDWFGGNPNGGWVFILYDAWVFQTPALNDVNVAVWCPVDHFPTPPAVLDFFRRYKGSVPIAMSRFGQQMLGRAGLQAHYVPHGIDTDVFRPLGKDECRALLKLPEDAFVVGMNANNKGVMPNRKAFPEVFFAFAEFAKHHSDALLYLHTEIEGHARGLDLLQLSRNLGISDRLRYVDQYDYRSGLPAEYVAATYNAFDVLANPSYGEGFGIPIIEAQSCGIPVIVSNHSAMPELVGPGWVVDGEPLWDDPMQSAFIKPSIEGIYKALNEAYESRGTHILKARTKALEYDAAYVFDTYWKPVLADLEERWNPAAAA